MVSRAWLRVACLICLTSPLIPGGTLFGQNQWALDTVVSAGVKPFGVAVTPDGGKILVTNRDTSGSVTVLAASDYSVLATIPVYGDYPSGIAVRPRGVTAFVTASGPNAVRVIDLQGDSILSAFYPPCSATTLYDIAITPDGLTAVMPDLNDACVAEGVRWFDATTKVSGSTFVSVKTAGVTFGIAIAPDTVTALVTTNVLTSGIKWIDLSTSSVGNINNIGPSYGVAITHKGDRAVISSDSVKVVSMADYSVTSAIPFQSNSSFKNVAITPDDRWAFVVGNFEVAVISLDGDSVEQTLSATGQNVAVSPDGMHAYVTDEYNGELRVYKFIGPGTGIVDRPFAPTQPGTIELLQNYPNPFNPSTMIRYRLSVLSRVSLQVYDVLGREVRTLINGELRSPGRHEVELGASGLPSGIYFCRLTASNPDGSRNVSVRKLILLK